MYHPNQYASWTEQPWKAQDWYDQPKGPDWTGQPKHPRGKTPRQKPKKGDRTPKGQPKSPRFDQMLAPEIKKDKYKDWNIPPPPTTTSSSSAKPVEDPAVSALLEALHSNQDGLAPAVQTAMQKVISHTNRTVVHDMYSSAGGLDQATQELEAAVHARNELHRSWQHFLAASVEEWQGFTQRFKDQEKIMQEHVKKAKANLRNTRKNQGEVGGESSSGGSFCGRDIRRRERGEQGGAQDRQVWASHHGRLGFGYDCPDRTQGASHCHQDRRAPSKKEMPRWYLAIHAAFWWARWNVTTEYSHRGLEPILPWLHSVRGRPDFTSESQAHLQACELAMHLGTCIQAPWRPDHAPRPPKPPLKVSFAPNITLRAIFHEAEAFQDWLLPDEALSNWPCKPWSLHLFCEEGNEVGTAYARPSSRLATQNLDKWIDLLSLREAVLISTVDDTHNGKAGQDRGSREHSDPLNPCRSRQYETWLPGFPQEGRPALEELPAWTQQIWQGIFQQQAEIEFQDEGPVLYLLTWYLRHDDLSLCKQSRTAKLDVYFEHWPTDLRRLWSDLINMNDDMDIFIVYPEPPRTTGAMHSGHLIIAQGHPAHTKAVLISTLESNALENHLTQVAVSAPRRANKAMIQRLSQVPAFVMETGYECWIDETWIDDEGPGVPLHDGCHVLQYIQHAGAGPRHTWQPQPQDTDSDASSLMATVLNEPMTHAYRHQASTPSGMGRCGDLLSLSEAVLNSPALPDWEEEPMTGSCSTPNTRSLTDRPQPAQGPHPPQPGMDYHGWARDLWEIFNVYVETITEGDDESIRIRSWYLQHDNLPRCDEPRELQLDAAFTEWQAELERLWSDRIQDDHMIHIQVVKPAVHHRPTRDGHYQADVILSQPMPHPHKSILAHYGSPDGTGREHHVLALSVTIPTPRVAFLRLVAPRAHWLRPHHISAQGRALHDGLLRFEDGHRIHVQPDMTTHALSLIQAETLLRSSPRSSHPMATAAHRPADEPIETDSTAPCLYKLSPTPGPSHLKQCGARLSELSPPVAWHVSSSPLSPSSDPHPQLVEEESALMQIHSGTPRSHKDAPAEPPWYQSMRGHTQPPDDPDPDDDPGSSSDHPQTPDDPSERDFWDLPDDPEEPGDPAPPSPHPPPEDPHRQNVMLFQRGQAPTHAYIAWHDHDAMMREIANHCLVPVHRILQLHDFTYKPEDLRAIKDLYPMIVHREFDIEPGSSSQLCLLDIEIFGQRHEPHYYIGPQVNRAVWQIPKQLVRRTLLRIIGQDDHCIRASQRCIVKMNGDVWNVQDARPRRIQHGDHFCVQIPPVEDCPHSDILRAWTGRNGSLPEQDTFSYSPSIGPTGSQSSFDLDRLLETDDDALIQLQIDELQVALKQVQHQVLHVPKADENLAVRSPCAADEDCQDPGPSCSSTAEDHELPKWIQALQPEFHAKVQGLAGSQSPEIYIQTWYLSHDNHLRCEHGRPLKLDPDPHQWHQDARALWPDLFDDGSLGWFEVVIPQPPTIGEQQFIAHLIISQHRDDAVLLADRRVETVVTVEFEREAQPTHKQLALVMPAWSLADDFFHVLGIHHLCMMRRARGRQCFIAHGPNILELGIRDLFHHADSLTIHVPEAPIRTQDGPYTRHSQVPPQTIDTTTSSSTPFVTADFRGVLQIQEELVQIELPVFRSWDQISLENDLCSFVDSLPHWQGQDIYKIEFYTDGSFAKGLRVGAAAVAIAHSLDGIYLLGALSQTMYGEHAYTGELCALAWALIWACQLTHFLPADLVQSLEFVFYFDCVAAGYQTSGWWHGKLHQNWHAIMRSLMQYLENRTSSSKIWSQHVYAHTGLLPNELADRIAKFASHLADYHQPIPWLHWFDIENIAAIQWIWAVDKMKQQDPTLPMLNGHMLRIPLTTQSTSTSKGHADNQSLDACADAVRCFTMRLATANVMTLMDSCSQGQHLIGARQLSLMQQFYEASCHIVAIQETRHKRINQNNEWYHVLGHPATPRGQAGIQVWVAKTLKFGSATISLNQIRVVYSDENSMILKIKLTGKTIALIAGHAPHASRPHAESVAYWQTLTAHVNRACRGLPIFFLGDTNAHLGSATSVAVGAHGAVTENGPGKTFHDWMLTHELFAPATFEQHHWGQHSTFSSIRGQHGHRLDYVGLPLQWFGSAAMTWTSDSIDLGLARDDHFAVCVDVPFVVQSRHKSLAKKSGAVDAVHAAQWALSWEGQSTLCDSLKPPSWETSVHEQAVLLSQQVHCALPEDIKKKKQSFRKRHLMPDTQALIRSKQDLFKRIKYLQAADRQLQVRAIFLAWKHRRQQDWSAPHQLSFAQVECQINTQLACTLVDYYRVVPQVQTAVRKDDAEFLHGLAQQAGGAHSVEGLQGLWRHVKGLLPKNKTKRDRQQFDLDQPMLQHFCELEAGRVTTWDQLLDKCLCRNTEINSERQSLEVHLGELPTLWQTEQLCLKQKAARA